ncbi:hypothetical protein AWE51_02570 [Aquimarina aggregata]|uniref:Calcineurin-like phosphoesterase domain-containing protein n=1 Tax=Aquimarina aggregata TaxID=1642818 RepID=A0A163CF02_9FLAO|nr:metallophosphoesterase [Aquimarina aggregata]KZS42343.1 hypothetical protein AWE51_02570 [Aquimarina aggregata]
MNQIKFSQDQQEFLKEMEKKLSSHFDQNLSKDIISKIPQFWEFLIGCEKSLNDRHFPLEKDRYDKEYGFALYLLNHEIPSSLTNLLKRMYKMPDSSIDFDKLIKDIEDEGWLSGDGSLYAISKYAALDPGWFISLLDYLWYKYLDPKGVHDFKEANIIIPAHSEPLPTNISIAVIGDWGTGVWEDGNEKYCPAQLVIDGLKNLEKQPDIIIHLGDVYYAGTENEELKNFVNMLPDEYKNKVFTLNSNHEMYNGANGYFNEALSSSFLTQQSETSYFAIEINDWIIVALDSAYYDESNLYLKGALTNSKVQNNSQIKFLTEMANKQKQLILMTHHNGITYDASELNNPLWDQVIGALGGAAPDVWYWGHIHNGIVYKEDLDITNSYKTIGGNPSKLRCCGHAAIPFGNASGLNVDGKVIDDVLYYAHTPMNAPNPDPTQKLRVLNGFAILEINNKELFETFYEVSNTSRTPIKKWSSVPDAVNI